MYAFSRTRGPKMEAASVIIHPPFLQGAATEGAKHEPVELRLRAESMWRCICCFDENEPPPRLESCRGLGDQVQGCITRHMPRECPPEVGTRLLVACVSSVDNNTLLTDVAAAVAQNDCG